MHALTLLKCWNNVCVHIGLWGRAVERMITTFKYWVRSGDQIRFILVLKWTMRTSMVTASTLITSRVQSIYTQNIKDSHLHREHQGLQHLLKVHQRFTPSTLRTSRVHSIYTKSIGGSLAPKLSTFSSTSSHYFKKKWVHLPLNTFTQSKTRNSLVFSFYRPYFHRSNWIISNPKQHSNQIWHQSPQCWLC